MPPAYVKPYVKRNKNDGRDAQAICEAVSRPTMRFVPLKTVEQQRSGGSARARFWCASARWRQRDAAISERVGIWRAARGLRELMAIEKQGEAIPSVRALLISGRAMAGA